MTHTNVEVLRQMTGEVWCRSSTSQPGTSERGPGIRVELAQKRTWATGADFARPDLVIAMEIEGGAWVGGQAIRAGRVRARPREIRPRQSSRLVGLLMQPEGWSRTGGRTSRRIMRDMRRGTCDLRATRRRTAVIGKPRRTAWLGEARDDQGAGKRREGEMAARLKTH